jgi:ABC-type sugar transport system permease subunit
MTRTAVTATQADLPVRPKEIRRRARRPKLGRTLLPYSFFLPAFLLVAAVSFIPLGYAVTQSLHAADYLGMGRFVGLQNYIRFSRTGGA